jgi:hypothetical protein
MKRPLSRITITPITIQHEPFQDQVEIDSESKLALMAMRKIMHRSHSSSSKWMVCLIMYAYYASSVDASSSSFPGTLSSNSHSSDSSNPNNNNWWPVEESSSDWEWADDDERTTSDEDFGAELIRSNNVTTVNAAQASSQQSMNATKENKPLQTLEKLQQMLDETDYLTTGRSAASSATSTPANPAAAVIKQEKEELWTSKDRSKYKKQQKRTQKLETASVTKHPPPPAPPVSPEDVWQQQYPSQWYNNPHPPLAPPSSANTASVFELASEAETTEASETDGDGLGYTLPNLPVYMSDDEDEGENSSLEADDNEINTDINADTTKKGATSATLSSQQLLVSQQVPPPQYGMQPPPPHFQQQQQQWGHGSSSYPYPPPSLSQPQALAQHQQYYSLPPPPPAYYYPRPYVSRIDANRKPLPHYQSQYQRRIMSNVQTTSYDTSKLSTASETYNTVPSPVIASSIAESHVSLITSEHQHPLRTSLLSLTKLSACIVLTLVVSYSAISPSNGHMTMYEYNQKFYAILKLVGWTALPPLTLFWFGIVDVAEFNKDRQKSLVITDENDNDEDDRQKPNNHHKTTTSTLVNAFCNAFSFGYCLLFCLQVVGTTFIRLGIFFKWERSILNLTPDIPLVIIPWVLREHGYKPKRITLIVQDFVASCLLSPILEEYLKLILLQRSKLPKNFQWRAAPKNRKNRTPIAETIHGPNNTSKEVTNVNAYISNMLAVTLGIKLADSIRRVCMYTKPHHSAKTFYAICRGVFPVRELCGTATALGLARRDVLGQHIPIWKLLLPGCVIHGMANFRGMKVRSFGICVCFFLCFSYLRFYHMCSPFSSGIQQHRG